MATKIRAYRPFEWAFPPQSVEREVISRLPTTDTDKPPLLFVHSIEQSARCFDEHWLSRAAERGFPAYAVSLRGHGASGGREHLRRATLRDYVHDVIQTAVSLPRQPVLVGHAFGGLVVAKAMARYPALAGVLVAPAAVDTGVGTALTLAWRSPLTLLRAIMGRTAALSPRLLFEQLDRITVARLAEQFGPESPLVQYQIVFHRPPGKPLGDAPVLVIGAEHDKLIPARDVRRTARYYGTDPWFYAGSGHDLMLAARWHEPLDAILSWADHVGEKAGVDY